MTSLMLSWPADRALSPNARCHWSVKARAKKKLRASWAFEAMRQGLRQSAAEQLELEIVFMHPDRRRRDLDNSVSGIKAGLDGLADVLKVDDSKWSLRIAKDVAPKGVPAHVLVHIKEL